MADAGQQLSDEQARQDAVLDALELGHADHERRLKALENAPPPEVPPEPPENPAPNPPPPGTDPGDRWGINLGKPQDPNKPWRVDTPLDGFGEINMAYQAVLYPVAHTIRFMDKNRINDDLNPPAWDEWEDALAWQVKLCNACAGHFWLNTHYRMNADMVKRTTAFVRANLSPALKTLVGWANEPWIGDQTDVGRQIKADTGAELGADAFFDFWARRMRETFAAAKSADPGCITVMETQTASTWVTGKLHDRIDDYDAIGVTCYYGPGLGNTPPNTISLDGLFQMSEAKLVNKEIPRLRDQLDFCAAHGKLAVSYEGGNHYALPVWQRSGREQVVQAMIDAQRDPRINTLYGRLLDVWNSHPAATKHRCHYNFIEQWTEHGAWGLGESLDTIIQSPKYRYAAGVAV